MSWIEMTVITDQFMAELVSNFFNQFPINGLEIDDPREMEIFAKTKPEWILNKDEPVETKDEVVIKAYFEKGNLDSQTQRKLVTAFSELKMNHPHRHLQLTSISSIEDQDWGNEWKKFFQPTVIGQNIVIKPTWQEYQAEQSQLVIHLDPGMAFGTGTHETTALCLEELEILDLQGKVVFDIGCGSGILSIAAAKMGAERVIAVDIDPFCLQATQENSILNGVERTVIPVEGNLTREIREKADLIIANILAPVIIELIQDIDRNLNKDGLFVVSGILENQVDSIRSAMEEKGLVMVKKRIKKDWVMITAKWQEQNA